MLKENKQLNRGTETQKHKMSQNRGIGNKEKEAEKLRLGFLG